MTIKRFLICAVLASTACNKPAATIPPIQTVVDEGDAVYDSPLLKQLNAMKRARETAERPTALTNDLSSIGWDGTCSNESLAPHWPWRPLNGHSKLERCVWVDEDSPRPSNAVLDAFRKDYWKHHGVIRFDVVEGEQWAPFGDNGAWIYVDVVGGEFCGSGDDKWPGIMVNAVDPFDQPALRVGGTHCPVELPNTIILTVDK